MIEVHNGRRLAGLDFTLSSTVESCTPGLALQVGGYHDKLPVLLDAVLARLARFTVRQGRFAVVAEKFEQFFRNWDKQQPYSWCTRLADELLQTGARPPASARGARAVPPLHMSIPPSVSQAGQHMTGLMVRWRVQGATRSTRSWPCCRASPPLLCSASLTKISSPRAAWKAS